MDSKSLSGNGERILVVDDELAILEFLKAFLTLHGYTVVCAGDAPNALTIFEKEKGKFDLLFTDVNLPGISGAELAKKIRRLKPHMPILLGSGYVNEESVLFITKGKRFPFLSKPYDANELLKAIKELIST